MQKLLNERLKPVPKIKEDGDFGQQTERLIKLFQALNSLGIDGIVGPKTWAILSGIAKTPLKPTIPLTTTASASWLTYAKGEIKQKEIKGAEHNPRIIAGFSIESDPIAVIKSLNK